MSSKRAASMGYALIISNKMDGQDGIDTAHSNVYYQPIEDITPSTIRTRDFVLPLEDATLYSSDHGTVYAYNVSLPYLKEVAHLAEVEKNIVVGQAFLYQGRNVPTGKPNAFQWALFLGIFLLAAFAIFS